MNFWNQIFIKEVFLNKEISISILLDSSILSFGTKLRKAKGIHKSLITKKINSLVIHGNPNSNYMACFSTYFRASGLKVYAIIHSHYQKQNLNYWLTIKNSEQVFIAKTKLEYENYLNLLKTQGFYIVSKYGACLDSLLELFNLWKEIDWKNYKVIVLDVGSGLTLLSLMYYFQIYHIYTTRIWGICIGRKTEQKIIQDLEILSLSILGRVLDFSNVRLFDSKIDPEFGKYSVELENYCKNFKIQKIFIDPIYSGKSLFTLEKILIMEKFNCEGVLYLHQGGILPFYKMYI